MSIVVTKAALALKNSQSNFQVVKYEAPKKKVKAAAPNEHKPEASARPDAIPKKDLGLKKIRHEIVKFGMSGFDSTKKDEAKIALAVSLGAKPPKKAYINYKDLMAKRKEEKTKERQEKEMMISKSVLHKVGKSKSKNKNPSNDVGHFLSGYGKVQKKDLKKDEPTRKKKRK